ncbi:hypothetical protein NNJEOMEG_03066 [Fundidesulfovibrio magnetotacticus]|uniref:Uncharacterized protein n=1 Tax=Fundidesulfovibrio magnetotacticus TaxID=2730080 RepID=A0A6V8LY93_9BACT|nr:hypothetical protein [Fundidesulfovibrio magnetotacticus]GFK95208.1 hypothetical protein NNJEOMEG_03066 [Fundidesulfovibrio magnetotacticus]
MRNGKPDFRLFGRVRPANPGDLPRLAATLPPDASTRDGDTLDIDYAGLHLDLEDFLQEARRLLGQEGEGHLDAFDDEARVLTRYELSAAGHAAKTHRYDDILEHTKGEGNW